jgi:hypothetical protein
VAARQVGDGIIFFPLPRDQYAGALPAYIRLSLTGSFFFSDVSGGASSVLVMDIFRS